MGLRTLTVLATCLGVLLAACAGPSTAPNTSSAPASGASGAAATAGVGSCGLPPAGECAEEAKSLTGVGATFPAPIYTKWTDRYYGLTGVKVNYQAVGSGGGIKAFTDKTADFAASDVPLTDAQIDAIGGGFYTIPTVLGAVVPTYNLPGVGAKLHFTGEVLADIFLGKITRWNDPAIAAENQAVALPDSAITVVHRSDGSGTTGVFTDYLNKVSPEWRSRVGSATSVNWPVGVGGSGNAGVAGAVAQTPGALGYVELIYAIQNKLGYGVVKNAAGKYVEASLESTTAAAEGVQLPDLGDLKGKQARISITRSTNPAAWPISTFTFWLLPKDVGDKGKALAIVRFMWWGTHEGQAFAKDLGYAPLPADVQKTAGEIIRSVKSNGVTVVSR